ncbi:MAG: TonB-dependent receptor [Pseudomonadota bacterium]
MKFRKVGRLLVPSTALLIGLGHGSFALAEEAMEEVVVTGSFIRGTPIDSASPVTTIDEEDLFNQGSPSVVEIIRRLSASSGVDGESNQFQSNASEGISNINIRGLGAQRTLVLLNGKRQVPVSQRLPAGRFVDINSFPRLAIKRIEVLKEGAAATYGSDAIGGVVNFITRDDFQGLEFTGGYTDIDGSDGNHNFGVIGGMQLGEFDWVTSFGYTKRNELSLRNIDNAQLPFSENPRGGFSSIGNPGVFYDPTQAGLTFAALAGGVKDPNCEALGGVDNSLFCRFRYTDFDNAIENETHYQAFSEINGEFGNGINLHAELLYAKVDVPEWKTSPSYPPQALFGDVQFVPSDHPGLVDMASRYPQFQQFIDSGNGANFYGRIVGVGADQGREAAREYDTYRAAVAIDGAFENGIGYDFGVTWSRSEGRLEGVDAQIGRTKLAFQGFGGFGCPATLDTAGNLVTNGAVAGQGGCLYYNPFSNAIQTSQAEATFGVVNPDFNPAVANSEEVLQYLDDLSTTRSEANQIVFDAVFQGDLFDGSAAWAAGYQYRRLDLETQLDDLINIAINPCPFVGQTDCAAQTGLRSFLAGSREVNEDADVHAVFFETALDVSENIDVQLAVRYEDYGATDTFDPKLAIRYDVTDWLTLRGSVQTTFRGPDLDATNPNRVTALSFVGPTAAFKAIDIIGNPDVNPEEAFTYNIGAIFEPIEGLTLTVDYWSYDFDNPIVVEDFNALVSAYVSGGAARTAVQEQIFCTGTGNDGSCDGAGIERIEVQTINGPSIKTSGIDIFGNYVFALGGGQATIGVDMSHTIEYEQDAYVKNGIQVSDSFDAAGFLNAGRGVRSLPDFKGRGYVQYDYGRHTASVWVNYITDYIDERDDFKVDNQTTVDVHYNLRLLEDNLRLTVSANNLFDEKPPLARVDLGYDAYTHNPFGRMVKATLTYRLGQ